jgi:hypothetical protein
MTWTDPIVDEVRRVRDAYAARFNYDLRAIFRDLKEQEKKNDRPVVSYAKQTGSMPQDLGPSDQSSKIGISNPTAATVVGGSQLDV